MPGTGHTRKHKQCDKAYVMTSEPCLQKCTAGSEMQLNNTTCSSLQRIGLLGDKTSIHCTIQNL